MLAMLLVLSGCIWPTLNPDPYHDDILRNIKIGASDRNELASFLGQPEVKLNNDQFWIYGQSTIIIHDTLGSHLHVYQSLLVEFENDVVKSFDVIVERYGCWKNGLCLVSGWPLPTPWGGPVFLGPERAAIVSHRDDDHSAKKFETVQKKCSIYLYKKENLFFGKDHPPTITMGPARDEPLHYKGYLFARVPSGKQRVESGNDIAEFECQSGSLLFFEIEQDMGWDNTDVEINRVKVDEGKEAIQKRNLLITW